MRKFYKKDLIKRQRTIIFILLFLVITTMTIGYAAYDQILTISGMVTVNGRYGNIEVTAASYTTGTNTNTHTVSSYSGLTVNFRERFRNNSNGSHQYSITITNNTRYDYTYNGFTYNAGNSGYTGAVSGITQGETIPSLGSKTFTFTTSGRGSGNTTYNTSVTFNLTDQPYNGGSVLASLNTTSIDLTTTDPGPIDIVLYNTYSVAKDVTFTLSNPKLRLVDSQGNALGTISIPANISQVYTAYITIDPSVIYTSGSDTTDIDFYFNSVATNLGTINLTVPTGDISSDDDPPHIGGVTLNIDNTEGSMTASWSRTDFGGSEMLSYTVMLFAENGTQPLETQTVGPNTTTATFTGKNEGNYYAKVYGEDQANNSGEIIETGGVTYSCLTPSTTNDYCASSIVTPMRWNYNVTNNIQNSNLGTTTAKRGVTYSSSLTSTQYQGSIDSIEVTINGEVVPHTYQNNTITVDGQYVKGDMIITGNSTCLIEGTKILLANGKYKKIEDITYNDLLAVWSYDTGTISYEYPIWIEKKHTTNHYQQTTFSDGSILKTLNYHGVYSPTYNSFISVDDYDRFKVGTKITKIIDGKLQDVTITKIEFKSEKVNYYHVVSTRYYNVIANDFLTTDGTVILTNLYGFDKNITWPSIRNSVLTDSNNLYTYDDLKDVLPYYMFIGLRAEEGKILSQYGLTKDMFKFYLKNNQVNPNMVKEVDTNNKGNRVWMVTTSDDRVTEFNKKLFLHEEGTEYTLPTPLFINSNFKGWYNTTDNKLYKPGDKIIINHGTHFIAMYK